MKPFWFVLMLMLLVVGLGSRATGGIVLNQTPTEESFGHHRWQEVLNDVVDSQGRVDYARLRSSPRSLNAYLDHLAMVSPDSHPEVFPDHYHQMAYWVNAYNALVLRTVTDHYPVASLDAIPGFRQQAKYKLGGVPYSIDALEQKLATTYYWQPLVLFALSDTSESAPWLSRFVYLPATLPEQLTASFQRFLARSDTLVIEPDCGPVTLSRFFYQMEQPVLRYLAVQQQQPEPTLLKFLAPQVDEGWRAELLKTCTQREVRFAPWDSRLRRVPRARQ